jgi:hypothetical protein
VTAAIVSCREIEMEDLKCIIDANNKLNILQKTNTKVKFQDYFLKVSAVMVNNSTNINKKKNHLNLLNTKKTMTYNVYLSNIYKIVSCREIEMEDLKCIIDANNKLNILQMTNTKVKFQDYFLLFKRVVVILSLPSPSIHGECRLFDPYCRIRKEICEIYNPSDYFNFST